MNKRNIPIWTKILALLSVLNIAATIICILSVMFLRDALFSQGVFLNMITPATNGLLSVLANIINGFTWLFVIANLMISLGMMLVAMLINRTKKTYLRTAGFAS